MFLSRRNPPPNGVRRPPSRVPFRPILEALEDRITPTGSVTVTNLLDTGTGTLRDAVAQADANTSGVFTINLVGGTYTLSQNSPLLLNNTNAGTTIVIQGSTNASNPTILNETGGTRALQVTSGTQAIIDDVTVKHGAAQDAPADATGFQVVGGGLLNDGGEVALTNDVFQSNMALATPGTAGVAGGGGIFSVGGTLVLDTVTLSNNVAQGGTGPAAPPGSGGNAFGGGLGEISSTVIVTNVPVAPGDRPTPPPVPFDPSGLKRPLLTVSDNLAQGGDGAVGLAAAAKSTSFIGADGGDADGGGLWLSAGSMDIVAASITGNIARGGVGGAGNSSADEKSVGIGGEGGEGRGGGLAASAEDAPQFTVQDSTFAFNIAQGGLGGRGGNGTASGTDGGVGGDGGVSFGGGVFMSFVNSGPGIGQEFLNSTVADNQSDAGNGGAGGNSIDTTPGGGGNSGTASGAGLALDVTRPVALINVTVAFNVVDASGGQGGSGGTNNQGVTGTTGKPEQAAGGGIASEHTSMPIFINSVVALNTLSGGKTTNGGPDVFGPLSESTRFSYFGDPSGTNNLLTSDVLFNSVTHTPGNSDAYGGFRDAQGNLVPADPLFTSTQPANNGGPTGTIEIQSDSYLIGKGTSSITGSALDQRGVPRGSRIDLGAVEFSGTPSPPPAPPGSPPPSSPPASPPSPPPPSLISAIIGLYIAEVEKDLGLGDPVAVQQAIDFNARFTVLFGINIAPFIEMIADTNVRNARGG